MKLENLTEEELQTIGHAMELLSRIFSGQFSELEMSLRMMFDFNNKNTNLDHIKNIYFPELKGYGSGGRYHGITCKDSPPIVGELYDMYKIIFYEKNKNKNYNVHSSLPYQKFSKHPSIEIEKIEE